MEFLRVAKAQHQELKGSAPIASKTRDRVLDAQLVLGYLPPLLKVQDSKCGNGVEESAPQTCTQVNLI